MILYIAAGAVSGIIAGMGMGGGTLLIPILTLFMDVPQKAAQAINLISFAPMAIIVTVINIKKKLLSKSALLLVAPSAVIAAAASALAAKYVPQTVLRSVFGVFLAVLGLSLLIKQFVSDFVVKYVSALSRMYV